MKILVFSDSHSNSRKMKEAIDLHKHTCEVVIFLGDGLKDIYFLKEQYPTIAFFAVKGNCDFFDYETEKERMLCLDGINIMITHGDLYGVKGGYGNIAVQAEKKGADAVFFGHTHIPYDNIMEINGKSIHLFNPGSVGYEGSYGVVNTSGRVLVTGHGKIS